MSLILSGTDGLSDVDGSAATPAIRGTDANTGMFFPAADTIAFSEGGVESMRINSAGDLAIGSTSPDPFGRSLTRSVAISSSGGGTSSGLFVTSGAGSRVQLGIGSTSTLLIYSDSTNFSAISTETALPLLFQTNQTERMRINSSGDVGIGTSVPGVRLHVEDVSSIISSGGEIIRLSNTSGQYQLNFGINNGSFNWIRSIESGVGAAPLVFAGGVEWMRIDASGNLGIGTSSPTSRLHVTRAAQQTDIDSADQVLLLENTSTDTAGNLSGIRFRQTNGTNSGNGFLGMSSTGSSSTRASLIFAPPNTSGNATERMRITSAGDVGIGTTNPGTPLQVVRNSTSTLVSIGSAGTNGTGTIAAIANCLSIGRSFINVLPNSATALVSGYGGNMLLISLQGASGVADIQYTFVVTGGWNSTAVLFSNSYGGNTATFTFSAVSGVTRVSHNHSGAINFTVHAFTGPGPA